MKLDRETLGNEFPLLRKKTYLNNCSYGMLSLTVEDAFRRYLQSRHENGSNWELWVGQLEVLRGVIARLLQCSPGDVSISTSLSESVNSLAGSLDPGERDTIVVTDFDFPTTSQIWLAQQRRGLRVMRAQADGTGVQIPLEHFDRLIDERTLLVSVPWVCYRNGVMLELKPIIDLAHQRGAMVLVDAYQAIGTLPFSAVDSGADFITGGCLKYLLGTAGIAFMYVRGSESSERIPSATGWFAQEDIFAMDIYHNVPARSARRFESGTPNVSATYACVAGIELLLGVGLETVHSRIQHLTALIAERAGAENWRLVTPAAAGRHGALMAIASTDAPMLVRKLAEENIVVSDRDGNLRVSPHFYNYDGDTDTLFRALEKHAKLLRRAA